MRRYALWILFVVLLSPSSFVNPVALAGQTEPRAPTGSGETPAVPVLIAYYSLTGTTEKMAHAVAEGVRQVPGAVPTVKKVDEVSKADLQSAQGIILGSPTYYANIPGKMKAAIDEWPWKMNVDFTDKVGGAFATGGGPAAGKEHVVVSLLLYMLNNRMVVAGPLYEDPKRQEIWGELGAAATTGPLDPGVSGQELDAARKLGQRVARVATRLGKR